MISIATNTLGHIRIVQVEPEAIHGVWALHESYQINDWWTITHIPTGLALTHQLGNQDAALRLLYGLPPSNGLLPEGLPASFAEREEIKRAASKVGDDLVQIVEAWRSIYREANP